MAELMTENTKTYVRGATNEGYGVGSAAMKKTMVGGGRDSMSAYFKSGAAKSPSPQRPSKMAYSPGASGRGNRSSGLGRDSSADQAGYGKDNQYSPGDR